jgi:hypothetical protein
MRFNIRELFRKMANGEWGVQGFYLAFLIRHSPLAIRH